MSNEILCPALRQDEFIFDNVLTFSGCLKLLQNGYLLEIAYCNYVILNPKRLGVKK